MKLTWTKDPQIKLRLHFKALVVTDALLLLGHQDQTASEVLESASPRGNLLTYRDTTWLLSRESLGIESSYRKPSKLTKIHMNSFLGTQHRQWQLNKDQLTAVNSMGT